MKQGNQTNNNEDSESFLSDQSNDPDIEAMKQTKKKRNKRKGKIDQKMIFQIAICTEVSSEHDMIVTPLEANSSDQKLNGDEYSEFDVELDGIRDLEYHGIKILSIPRMPVNE